jgi:hypothetical protein
MNNKVEEFALEFENFAEQLFSKDSDIQPNSCPVELEIQDNSLFTDFLYEVFIYGFKKKITELKSVSAIIDETKFFDTLKRYMRAIGFEVILHDVTRDSEGEICDIKISFEPYYEQPK